MRTRLFLVITALLLLSTALPAQLPEQSGPFVSGWRDVSFTDPNFGQGTILARMYYPALAPGQNAAPDTGGGPYPIVGFQHGWTQSAADFDNLCRHLATWGYVIASTNTETGLFPDTAQFARDTRSLLHWTEDESDNAASWLFGMGDVGADWPVIGNSLGASTLFLLIGIESRVRLIYGMAPPFISGTTINNLNAYTGDLYLLTGTDDGLVPTSSVAAYYNEADNADRRLYQEIAGAGHGAPSDTPGGGGESMPGNEQYRLARRLATVLLEAEVRGLEDEFFHTLGADGNSDPITYDIDFFTPAFWVGISPTVPNSLAVGIAAQPNEKGGMAWSLTPASIPTPAGILGLDLNDGDVFWTGLFGADGMHEQTLTGRASWLGNLLYLQALAKGGGNQRLTRVDEFPVP